MKNESLVGKERTRTKEKRESLVPSSTHATFLTMHAWGEGVLMTLCGNRNHFIHREASSRASQPWPDTAYLHGRTQILLSGPPPRHPLLLLFALPRSRQALANLAAIQASQYLAERHRFFNLGFTAILKKVAAASRSLHGTGTESGACVRNPKNRHFFLLQLSIKSARRQTPKSESDKSPQLTAAAAPPLTSQCDKMAE